MKDLTFYSDRSQTFECMIEVTGASMSQTQARLLLEFPNITYLFEGKIDTSSGRASVTIPPLVEQQGRSGRAALEVIAENSYVVPMELPFAVRRSRDIRISEARVSSGHDSYSPSITVTPIEPPEPQVSLPPPRPIHRTRPEPRETLESTERALSSMLDRGAPVSDILEFLDAL